MSHYHHQDHHSHQGTSSQSPQSQMSHDSSLNGYNPQYYGYPQQHSMQSMQQQQQQHHIAHQQQGMLPPVQQQVDTIQQYGDGTPSSDSEVESPPDVGNGNGKRAVAGPSTASRKKARKEGGGGSEVDANGEKAKPTRGSRACTVCRRLKMKCVGAEQGPPCKRCSTGNHECIFEESNRGKRSSKKHEILSKSLKKMEQTLDTVLRSIGNPSLASGMVSRSQSPTPQTNTQALLESPSTSPTDPFHQQQQQQGLVPTTARQQHVPGSPKLHSLPDNALNPLGLLAEASLANRRAQAGGSDPYQGTALARTPTGELSVGVASANYFKPGPMTILPLRRLFIERQIQPEMLNFVETEEVVALFDMFFSNLATHANILDREFHTPSLVCSRSPFLLTTICAIAAKFYPAKPELHGRLTDLARKLAFSVPAQGYKSVEIVQAYLLLALWGCGAVERYEQDKTWMLLGMAIRMGTDLNLHRKTAVTSQDTPEGRARDREVHNRERTWLMCFVLDRSFSAQMGKPHSIQEDFIIRNVRQWYASPAAKHSDIGLAAYVDLQRIMSRSLDFLYSATNSPSGLHTDCDYLVVIKTMEAQILGWQHEWYTERFLTVVQDANLTTYLRRIAKFYFHYAMLVLNSFGLQNAIERSPADVGHFFARVHSSAKSCAITVRDELGPSGYMRYSPDSHFVLTSYAVLSLLKLVRPEFRAFLDDEPKAISLVKDLADTLESIAANPQHTPALYGGFLRALIAAKLPGIEAQHDQQQQVLTPGGGPMQTSALGTPTRFHGDMGPPTNSNGFHSSMFNGHHDANTMNDFQFTGEMGPVADMSTFPPTMVDMNDESVNGVGLGGGMQSMDAILTGGFWDSVLMPGYSNSLEGLSGGFVFGAGGSGLITPRLGMTPQHSGANTPARGAGMSSHLSAGGELTQQHINAAFNDPQT